MVYGRYNELVFMDVNGVYKLTNITGGHQPVGEEEQFLWPEAGENLR